MKRKLLYIVEAMGGGVFTYIVGLTNELVDYFEIYIAYAVRPRDIRVGYEPDIKKQNSSGRETTNSSSIDVVAFLWPL